MIKVANSGCKSVSVSSLTATRPEIPELPFSKKMVRNVIKRLPDKTNPEKRKFALEKSRRPFTLRFEGKSCHQGKNKRESSPNNL